MKDQVNYPELKARLFKFYNYFELVFGFYFKGVNVADSSIPAYVIDFLIRLKDIKKEWENLLNNILCEVTTVNVDLSKFDILLTDPNSGIDTLCCLWQNYILSEYFDNSRDNKNELYFQFLDKLEACKKNEMNLFRYIHTNQVEDEVKQKTLIKNLFGVDIESEPISIVDDYRTLDAEKIKRELSIENKKDNLGCLLISCAVFAILPAILAALMFGEDSDGIVGLVIGTYVVLMLIIIPFCLFATDNGRDEVYSSGGRRSRGSSFRSKSRGRSLDVGWKIKQYDPQGWRKKNGTNLFKQTGRGRKSWF
ncbi:MAG: hypothetical protein ACI4BD_02300 [Paludibacteraceae bacterium]